MDSSFLRRGGGGEAERTEFGGERNGGPVWRLRGKLEAFSTQVMGYDLGAQGTLDRQGFGESSSSL